MRPGWSLPSPLWGGSNRRQAVRGGVLAIKTEKPHPAHFVRRPPHKGEVKKARSTADQRAVAFLERTEGLRRRDGRFDVVEVARILGVGRLLHFEQIGVVDLAAVGADLALAEQRI